jgi:transcriptional regulator with XRE-family HTH domain
MEVRKVRHALRLLRSESGKSLDEIEGINRATVHRIENVKGDPDYSPRVTSVALIVEACGSTLGQFFTELDAVEASQEAAGLLAQLTDDETVRQLRGFLRLPLPARQALAMAGASTFETTPALAVESTPAPTRAKRTRRRRASHRSPAGRKTGT